MSFPRSDGTQRPGPYRRSLAEALRDLTELRRLQRRQGDAAMLRALYSLDADAMTAFFVENMENQRDQRAREKNHDTKGQKYGESEILADGCLVGKIDDKEYNNPGHFILAWLAP